MRATQGIFGIALLAMLGLAGCGNGNEPPKLMNIHATARQPDEFAILPTKPLVMPKDLSALPPPNPSAGNLADPTPDSDAVAALGGRPSAVQAGGIPAADAALVNAASRYGVMPGVRQNLADADLTWRKNHRGRPLDRLFNSSVYFRAYRAMELDAYANLEYWRSRGLATPSAPPKPKK